MDVQSIHVYGSILDLVSDPWPLPKISMLMFIVVQFWYSFVHNMKYSFYCLLMSPIKKIIQVLCSFQLYVITNFSQTFCSDTSYSCMRVRAARRVKTVNWLNCCSWTSPPRWWTSASVSWSSTMTANRTSSRSRSVWTKTWPSSCRHWTSSTIAQAARWSLVGVANRNDRQCVCCLFIGV